MADTNAPSPTRATLETSKVIWGTWVAIVCAITVSILVGVRATFLQPLANASSVGGAVLTLVGVYLAIRIYSFQQEDLHAALQAQIVSLDRLAFATRELQMREALTFLDELVKSELVTDVLVISRLSAIPAFWLSKQVAAASVALLERNGLRKLLIGPDSQTFTGYCQQVEKFLSGGGTVNELPQTRVVSWQANGVRISNRIKDEYDGFVNSWIKKDVRQVKFPEGFFVNAVIAKRKNQNLYGSPFEVIFFGEGETRSPSVPAVLRPPVVYQSAIALLANLWRPEVESVLTLQADKKWLEEFFAP